MLRELAPLSHFLSPPTFELDRNTCQFLLLNYPSNTMQRSSVAENNSTLNNSMPENHNYENQGETQSLVTLNKKEEKEKKPRCVYVVWQWNERTFSFVEVNKRKNWNEKRWNNISTVSYANACLTVMFWPGRLPECTTSDFNTGSNTSGKTQTRLLITISCRGNFEICRFGFIYPPRSFLSLRILPAHPMPVLLGWSSLPGISWILESDKFFDKELM